MHRRQREGEGPDAAHRQDAGDDPDATNSAHLTADVRLLPVQRPKSCSGRRRRRRRGRLGLDVGGPAISRCRAATSPTTCAPSPANCSTTTGWKSPSRCRAATDGEKTLNARLGILGGISILGTTGIVRPVFDGGLPRQRRAGRRRRRQTDPNQRRVHHRRAQRSSPCSQLPELDEACFVQMGDFVKAAFQTAVKRKMQRVCYIGAMAGKLTKMGQGLAVTHAWKAEIDRDLLADSRRKSAPRPIWSKKSAPPRRRASPPSAAGARPLERVPRALAQKAIRSLKPAIPVLII